MVSPGRAGRASAWTGPAVMSAIIACVLGAGCGHVDSPSQDYAQSACDAYRHTGHDQISTSVEQAAAIRDVARSDVRAAAAFDSRWADLRSDMVRALDLQEAMQDSPPDTSDRFFDLDVQVQDACRDAGRDIGDLEP